MQKYNLSQTKQEIKKARVEVEIIYIFADFAKTTVVHWIRLLKTVIFIWLSQACATSVTTF